jgi:hypothetical protein
MPTFHRVKVFMQNPAIDTALLRLYYLQQLGVTVYVGRDTGTAADMAVAQESASFGVETETETVAAAPAVISARKSLLDAEDTASAQPSVKTAGKSRTAAATTAVPVQDESLVLAPFQLLFFMPDPRLAVALQIPALAKPVLPEAEGRLLQNILRWLGVNNANAEAALLNFRWPLPGLPAGDAQSAGRNLLVFLQQAAAANPWQRLLLLGQGPALCLDAATGGAALPYQCWATHSLAEMLAVPELKREVWRHLLSLHKQL